MATMPCPRCKTELQVGAPFCTSCGVKMADFSVDGVPPGMMPVCGGCGALTASDRGSCMLCGASYTLRKLVPSHVEGRYFTRVLAHFLCRSCGQRSPLNALDVDGQVTCTRCGLTQAYDVSVWSEALETAHGVSDIAYPKPEGRFPSPGDPSIADHPAASVGKNRSALSFDASAVTMDGAVMRTRSISLEAAPGHPLCETCHAPLVAHYEGAQLRIGCEACNSVMRYALPTPIERLKNWPAGIYANDCCLDRPEASMVQSAGGAVAIKCPTCNAALEARVDQFFVSCTYCRTACRIPSRTLWALHTEKIEATPFWLLFEGPSQMRHTFVARVRADADQMRRAAERAERERQEAERRAEHTRQIEMPAPPAYTRRDHLLRASVGVVLTLLVGAIGWGGEIVSIVQTGQSQSGGLLGRLFGIGVPSAPVSVPQTPVVTPAAPAVPVPPMTYARVTGCSCDPAMTGLAEPADLGVRIGTTMQLGAMVTTTVDWALVGSNGVLVNLSAGNGAPSTVIESHTYQIVVACELGLLHVIDGSHITSYRPETGALVATGTAEPPVLQTGSAIAGLAVSCIRGVVEDNAVSWTGADGVPRRTTVPAH